tara:strand:+ start:9671 stop:11161 length:1491 start_codon:yes stop_codon:yes gene_type:complete
LKTLIRNCLISVSNKEKLELLANYLNSRKVNIIASGGTSEKIKSFGIQVKEVSDLTRFPEILNGRVKTLHPHIYANILSKRNKSDLNDMLNNEVDVQYIDLVIVDLYPFSKAIKNAEDESLAIENIDIGGVSLLRAAAKNSKHVCVVSDISQYESLINEIEKNDGYVSKSFREECAFLSFKKTSEYDSLISEWFVRNKKLRYGENPHQEAIFLGDLEEIFNKIQGKELSYNNLLDVDAAVNLISEFTEPTIAIFKHTNPCGVSSGKENEPIEDIWDRALSGDPVSAFGGIIIANKEVSEGFASKLTNMFYEILIAPSYSQEALIELRKSPKRIILQQINSVKKAPQRKTVLGGILKQNYDDILIKDKPVVKTIKKPTQDQVDDLNFANKIVKHTKSNAIVLVKNKVLLSSGMGQSSRIDALEQAVLKADKFENSLENSVMASDAFFPFSDCIQRAHEEGIVSVIQPGGSIRDKESIELCDKLNISMVMTDTRHFKH